MFPAKVYASSGTFEVIVDFDKTTTHPDSLLFREGCLTDPNCPLDLRVYCSPKGAVSAFEDWPVAPVPGPVTQSHLKIVERDLDGVVSIRIVGDTSGAGPLCGWFSNLVYVEVVSEAHGEHIIELLTGNQQPGDSLADLPSLFV
jgi:hypothetical protein